MVHTSLSQSFLILVSKPAVSLQPTSPLSLLLFSSRQHSVCLQSTIILALIGLQWYLEFHNAFLASYISTLVGIEIMSTDHTPTPTIFLRHVAWIFAGSSVSRCHAATTRVDDASASYSLCYTSEGSLVFISAPNWSGKAGVAAASKVYDLIHRHHH